MTRPSVKICGLQSLDIIESIITLPVDHIGFIFAKSKRQVSPEQVGEMLRYVNNNTESPPLAVGVFVNPTKQELKQALASANLDVIQLHGAESPEFCQWVKETLRVKVFKVFSVSSIHQVDDVKKSLEPYAGAIDTLMLDTYDPVIEGGTGKTFAWDCIPLYQEWTKKQGIPLLIAGGLDASNVAELIDKYNPDGIDVSSGVETNGVKDINKIADFVERVKNL